MDIPGPAEGELLTALMLCQVRGWNITYAPGGFGPGGGIAHYLITYANERHSRMIYPDARGAGQVVALLEAPVPPANPIAGFGVPTHTASSGPKQNGT